MMFPEFSPSDRSAPGRSPGNLRLLENNDRRLSVVSISDKKVPGGPWKTSASTMLKRRIVEYGLSSTQAFPTTTPHGWPSQSVWPMVSSSLNFKSRRRRCADLLLLVGTHTGTAPEWRRTISERDFAQEQVLVREGGISVAITDETLDVAE